MFWSRLNPFANSSWSALRQLHDQMDRLFDRFGDARGSFGVGAFPALNVWEENEALYVEAELPGLDLKDVEIFVTGQNQLTIKGERKQPELEKSHLHRQERVFGNFVRTVTLPFPVDADKVDARLENGVLTIHLPKHEAARPRRIAVKA